MLYLIVTAEDQHMLSVNNNYDEREKKVLELYDQGKSTRDIAKELRMSLREGKEHNILLNQLVDKTMVAAVKADVK